MVSSWKAEPGDRESKLLCPFFFCAGKTAPSVVVVFLICSWGVSDSGLEKSNAGPDFKVHDSAFYHDAATGMPYCLNDFA